MSKYMEYLQGLKQTLAELGIKEGDILYVASDITALMYKAKVDCGVKARDKEATNEFISSVVDVLKESVGESGTIMFPVFSWAWCRGLGFDYYESLGEVGSLNNWILKNRPDFKRTQHPMYSFMVYGKHADELCAMTNQDAWGEASPFAFLTKNHAKQLFFDIDAHQGFTYVHYVEQIVDVPYRHPKYFFGNYKDANGITEMRMYSMYSRDLELTTDVGCTNEFLISKGVAKQLPWNELKFTLVDLVASYPVIYDDITKNNGVNTLYFEDYTFDLNKPKTYEYEVGKVPARKAD